MRVNRAVILAAGRGRRLGELGTRIPKALVPIAGRPAALHLLDALARAGIDTATLVIGHLGDQVEAALGRRAEGVTLDYVEQPEPLGTADALVCARDQLAGSPFLVAFTDVVTTADTCDALLTAGARQLELGEGGAILTTDQGDVSRGAAVVTDAGGVVQVLEEKAPRGRWPGAMNSAGMYVFGPAIWRHAAAVTPSERGELELTAAVVAHLAAGARYVAVATLGRWFEVGDPAGIRAADEVLRCAT